MKPRPPLNVLQTAIALSCLTALLLAPTSAPAQVYGFSSPFALNDNAATDIGQDIDPKVATDGAGNWVTVWVSAENLGGTIGFDNDLFFSRSTDNGATWTSPAVLNDNAATDSVGDSAPRIAADSSGNFVVVWSSGDDLGATIGTDTDILFVRSTNGGATWSSPAALNSNATTDTGGDASPHISHDGSGDWLAVWNSAENLGGTISTDDDIFVSRSTDAGGSWSAPVVLNSNATTDAGADGGVSLAGDGTGRWIAVWNTNDSLGGTVGTDPDCVYAISTDDGATWSAISLVTTNATADAEFDTFARVETDGSGTWVIVWHSGADFGAQALGTDFDVMFIRSADDGANWSAALPVNSDAATDSSSDSVPEIAYDSTVGWLVTWTALGDFTGTSGGDWDQAASLSTDGGATWAPMTLAFPNATTDNGNDFEHGLASDGAGNWVSVWETQDDTGGLGSDWDIYVSRSSTVPVELSAFTLE